MSTALATAWMRRRMLCVRCRVPLDDVATRGGWSPHLCHDRLRTTAFDQFLTQMVTIHAMMQHRLSWFTLDTLGLGLPLMFLRMPPWERPIARKILLNAGVSIDWPEDYERSDP